MEQYLEAGEWPPLPDCPFQFLIDHLFDLGPEKFTPMGSAPISWPDIVAWEEKTGFDLQPWAARLLKSLSAIYLSEKQSAEDPLRPMPWLEMRTIIDRREQVGRKVGDFFKGMIAAQAASKGKKRPNPVKRKPKPAPASTLP